MTEFNNHNGTGYQGDDAAREAAARAEAAQNAARDAARDAVHDAAEAAQDATGTSDPLKQFVDHQKKAVEEVGKAVEALLPDRFWEHGKEARREFGKGVKVLVDAAVDGLEKANRDFEQRRRETARPKNTPASGGSDRPASTGPQKVKVVVD